MSIAPTIPAQEFANRRSLAAQAAQAAGLDALLVCSRGGGTVDRFADVMYLTNFYTPFPYTPDHKGSWSGRAHSFLVLPIDGSPRLIIDVPKRPNVHIEDENVICTKLVIEATIQALHEIGLAGGRIGLVGEDVMPVSFHRAITAALPGITFEPADSILVAMRRIKSTAEIALLRHASAVGSRMMDVMMAAVLPGASHGDVVTAGMQSLLPAGGILYNSFMASGRGGDNPKFVQNGFPTWGSPQRLAAGDWFRAGISGVVGGYFFDLSRSKAVGGASSERQVSLFEAAISCVETGIAAIRPGATAGDLARAGLGKQRALGFEMKGVFSALGHGIGLGWDAPWLTPEESTPIVPGMVLCFERTVEQDGYVGDFEETVLVTETGIEMLTNAAARHY